MKGDEPAWADPASFGDSPPMTAASYGIKVTDIDAPHWFSYSMLALTCSKGRAVLVLTFDLSNMTLTALLTSKPKKGQPKLSHVLDSHAHRLIGVMPDLKTAVAVAERFASDWTGGTDFQLCSCCAPGVPTIEP
jgi:hypothetical protein